MYKMTHFEITKIEFSLKCCFMINSKLIFFLNFSNKNEYCTLTLIQSYVYIIVIDQFVFLYKILS